MDRYLTQNAGVTGAQASALIFLDKNDGCSQKELSRGLGLDTSALTGMIDRLRRKEMVEKLQSESDRRASTIHITEQGRSALGRVIPILRSFNGLLDDKFGEEAMSQFCDVLEFLIDTAPKHWQELTNDLDLFSDKN